MEYEDVVKVVIEHETSRRNWLEIDLEDLEDEFIIDEEESELDYDIADSCYESVMLKKQVIR